TSKSISKELNLLHQNSNTNSEPLEKVGSNVSNVKSLIAQIESKNLNKKLDTKKHAQVKSYKSPIKQSITSDSSLEILTPLSPKLSPMTSDSNTDIEKTPRTPDPIPQASDLLPYSAQIDSPILTVGISLEP